ARLQVAHRHQPVVGLDRREPADVVGVREVADRRQLAAGPQMPVVDLPLDAGHDLIDQRLVTARADGQGEHGRLAVSISSGPVAGPVQLCYLTAKLSITVSGTV